MHIYDGRARMLSAVENPSTGFAIPNTKEQTVCCVDPRFRDVRWGQMDSFNKALFRQRRSEGQVKRNQNLVSIGVPVELVT